MFLKKMFLKFSISRKSEIESFTYDKIKVFKNLPKEQWKVAYNEICEIIENRLRVYGFERQGRKFIRLSYDLLEIIEIDNRGSWTGLKDDIKIRIGLVPYCWKGLFNEYYLVGSKQIDEIDKSIRKHFKISQEYKLFAEYISDRLINNVFPFFEKYNSTRKITNQPYIFPYYSKCGGNDIFKSQFLILFSELKQHINNKAIEILDNEIEYNSDSLNKLNWKQLKELVENNEWNVIDDYLEENEIEILQKLNLNLIKKP